jgi:peptidoglycan/xylan/chitin deacetylase (PgdA/CDA1 family)
MTDPREIAALPRVSVITIFYNAEAHLREAIDSVLAQDFGDFELLLVDDGSTDSSTDIAREYEARDPRVRYFEHPGHANRGMSAARNLGLGEALGELVAFIDADDRWRASKLREQMDLLDRLQDVDAVGGSVNYWASHNGGKDRIVPTAHVRDRPIPPGEATLALYPLGRAHAPSMSDLLFRRKALLAVGGSEEAFRGAYEDQALLAKFYLNSTLYFTDTVWSDYRLHDASCMAQVARTGRYDEARRTFLEWFASYLERSPGGGDVAIKHALRRALRSAKAGEGGRLRELAKSVPYAVPVARAARSALRRLRPMLAPGPAILMYHRIAEESFDPWGLAVSPANFADQLDWMKHNRAPLPLEEFVELNRRGQLPRNAIALTFDDGYACNARTATPLLEALNIPATIFISPELVERGREFWWDELERIILGHRDDTVRLYGRDIQLGEPRNDDRHWQSGEPPRTPRQQAYREIWSILHGKPPTELEDGMAQLREQADLPDSPRSSHRPLCKEEIRAIPPDLVAFGSHALTHPSLPRLAPPEQAREIDQSVSRCEELTGVRPISFAYPYGDHEPGLEPLVERAGFLCACKADGWFVTRKTNRFALPRIAAGNSGPGQLALLLGRP